MMEELSSDDHPDLVASDVSQIANQLQEAALTDVTKPNISSIPSTIPIVMSSVSAPAPLPTHLNTSFDTNLVNPLLSNSNPMIQSNNMNFPQTFLPRATSLPPSLPPSFNPPHSHSPSPTHSHSPSPGPFLSHSPSPGPFIPQSHSPSPGPPFLSHSPSPAPFLSHSPSPGPLISFPETNDFLNSHKPAVTPSQFPPPPPLVPSPVTINQIGTPVDTSQFTLKNACEVNVPPPPTIGFVRNSNLVTATPPREYRVSSDDAPPSPPPSAYPSTFPQFPQAISPAAQQNVAPIAFDTNVMDAPPNISQAYNTVLPPTANTQPSYQSPSYPQYQQTLNNPSVDYNISALPIEEEVEASSPNSGGGGGYFSWFSSGVGKVMEKTKSSVETMITTLDPGMKEVIYAGGVNDVNIIVATSNEIKIAAVRQAFIDVFGRATVFGFETQPSIAPQPVGFNAGMKGAEDRMDNLRRNGRFDENQVMVSIESFIVELLPDRWFDVGCICLKDTKRRIELCNFSQAVPIESDLVQQAEDATPPDYPLRWSGLAKTVGQIIQEKYAHIDHRDWHEYFCGISRRQLLYVAAKVLAFNYRQRIS